MSKRPYISTGHAAKLLGVTPDTVLKWVKKGRLIAMRTAGGHFRIPREQIDCLVETQSTSPSSGSDRPQMNCWEFFAEGGEVAANCKGCLVHRSRATRCWELARYPKEAGFNSCFHNKGPCSSCPFFREKQKAPVRLLVVSDNAELRRRLATQAETQTRFRVEFAAHGYDCSAQVDRFRPEMVLIDGTLPVDQCAGLCMHLASDPRIPGVKIIMASPRTGRVVDRAPGVVGEVAHPVSLDDVVPILDAAEAGGEDGRVPPSVRSNPSRLT